MNFKPGDLVHLQLSKSEKKQESGLKLEERNGGKIYVRKVTGLVKRRGLPVEPGDELVSLHGTDVEDMTMPEMKRIIKDELRFNFSIRKYDPDEEESEEEEEEEEEEYEEQYRASKQVEQYPDEIQPGYHYILEGIKLKEYNGERVEVIQPGKKPGKWEVEVVSSGAILAVREEKLVQIPQDSEEEEEEEEILNDLPEEEEEEEEEPEEEVEEHMLSVEGYIIEPGDTMKLRGLKKKAKLNGTLVSVIKLSAMRKEWKVELANGTKMSVPGSNLRHVQ
ncbi:unnamed protein product [Cylindrotheca closterium]|uniref:PDZ domain-containing protein n=1 Tax=Cylindrotheca closterium TaxID=2856 RepID=A0AAD2G424_9STRA|nr:unnamed protein product [Cylindrotheca closterium]